MSIPFTSIVSELPATIPFVGPETLERQRGEQFRLRLGANESAFGVSPKAADAMRQAITRVSWYNDPEGYELRSLIASLHGVDLSEVVLGGGIDELLGLVVRMLITPGTPVVSSLGAYPTFNYHVAGFGGELHAVPYREDRIDLETLSDTAKRVQAPLVYLANPDNPMGTWHDAETVQAFIETLHSGCVLILDEAYIEFAPRSVFAPMDPASTQVIRMRTFSKAHGMAGARIGYAIAHQSLISGINKIRNHFGVNRIAQAGALASLGDPDFVATVVKAVDQGRRDYMDLASSMGLNSIDSATNFVAIDLEDGNQAQRMLKLLEELGVFVRMSNVAPLNRCIRVTVGTPVERQLFAECFRKAFADLD